MALNPLIVTRGFGNGTFSGTIPFVVTRGYTIAVAIIMHTEFFDRVFVETSSTGTGDITPGAAVATMNPPGPYLSFSDLSVADGTKVTILITDVFISGIPRDFELDEATYYTAGPTLTRDLVLISKINGVVGTSSLNLSGSAQVANVASANDLSRMHAIPDKAIDSEAPFNDYSAADVGTLTNAPVAGNPSKWIRIHDAGAFRYIPVWG